MLQPSSWRRRPWGRGRRGPLGGRNSSARRSPSRISPGSPGAGEGRSGDGAYRFDTGRRPTADEQAAALGSCQRTAEDGDEVLGSGSADGARRFASAARPTTRTPPRATTARAEPAPSSVGIDESSKRPGGPGPEVSLTSPPLAFTKSLLWSAPHAAKGPLSRHTSAVRDLQIAFGGRRRDRTADL